MPLNVEPDIVSAVCFCCTVSPRRFYQFRALIPPLAEPAVSLSLLLTYVLP